MKVVITGAGGMVGSDLTLRLSSRHKVLGVGRRPAPHLRVPFFELDLSQAKKVRDLWQAEKPEVVLHAAAMTEVDLCETERQAALTDNLDITRNVTDASNDVGAWILFFSTDFVFDGKKKGPYEESDPPNPVSVYGETKLLGERYVSLKGKQFVILRASWVFGVHGDNFPQKILRQAEAGKTIRVVSDEFGNPTYTWDLAGAVEEVLGLIQKGFFRQGNQTYHVTNEGTVSRFDFARAILKGRNCPDGLLLPVLRSEVRYPAARPQNSALSTEKIKTNLGIRLRPWEKALEDYLGKIPEGLRR